MNDLIAEMQNAAKTVASPNCADVVAIIISTISLVVSSIVAIMQVKISKQQAKISGQQNRIALFEKRYEIYELIQDSNRFIWKINAAAHKNEDICVLYVMSKCKLGIEDDLKLFGNKEIVASRIMDSSQKIYQAEFLFSQDIADYAKCLGRELQMIAILCLHPESENIKNRKESLKELQNRYDSEKLSEKITKELRTTIGKKANGGDNGV